MLLKYGLPVNGIEHGVCTVSISFYGFLRNGGSCDLKLPPTAIVTRSEDLLFGRAPITMAAATSNPSSRTSWSGATTRAEAESGRCAVIEGVDPCQAPFLCLSERGERRRGRRHGDGDARAHGDVNRGSVVDIVGTGGDGHTRSTSTAASIVAGRARQGGKARQPLGLVAVRLGRRARGARHRDRLTARRRTSVRAGGHAFMFAPASTRR